MKKKLSKRMNELKNCINESVQYDFDSALELLKTVRSVKFVESVDVAINLGIDPKRTEQNIRSHVLMPYAVGKNIRVIVFTQGNNIIAAKKVGADLAGLEDVCNYIKKEGCKNIDVVVASPDVMNIVSKLGAILGPRGLMPNPKMGTVSWNIEESVRNIKLGNDIRYKSDRYGIIHATIGKINFNMNELKQNFLALIKSIKKMKPTQLKGTYIKKVCISTTMGRSVIIENIGVDVF